VTRTALENLALFLALICTSNDLDKLPVTIVKCVVLDELFEYSEPVFKNLCVAGCFVLDGLYKHGTVELSFELFTAF
jgi:hypothetical protein